MRLSAYIKIKRIHSSCFAPVFTGTNTTVSLDNKLEEYMPCFFKSRKEAIEAIAKHTPQFVIQTHHS